MYKSQLKKPKHFDYDLIVVGSGSGGGVAAHLAAKAGKKVAIIESGAVGGECPNFGCVPTKALLQAAETYEIAKNGAQFGIYTHHATFNYGSIKAWKDKAVANTGTSEGRAVYAAEGIELVRGKAHFLSPWIVSIGRARLSAQRFLLATGTHDVVPPIPGLKEHGFMTYREAIDLTRPPKSLFVIGGGAIGCEFTQLFNTFGTKVHIAEMAPHLIPKEDHEVGELIEAIFESRGVRVHTGTQVLAVGKQGLYKVVTFRKNGKLHKALVHDILLSAGKAPNVDMGLENAGVEYDKRGVRVDRFMATTAPHIYAAGDVAGPYMFTHMAAYQSRLAAHNMYSRNKIAAEYTAVPRCIFVDPEAASTGATETELSEHKIPYQSVSVPISVIGRANTSNREVGFVKLLATPKGILLGGSIVSPRAGEMLQEVTMAVRLGLSAREITETIHAFPTWSEAVRIAAAKIKVY